MKKKIKNSLIILTRFFMEIYYKIFFNDKNSIRVKYYYKRNNKNFGDVINYFIVEKLTGLKVINVHLWYKKSKHIMAIGSILQCANKHSLVWGSGFISSDASFEVAPKKIFAVRGPLTRELLMKNNIECPEVYGDPGLLLPKIYKPKIEKKYKLGIVPHYIDKSSDWINFIDDKDVLIIDPVCNNPMDFIDNALSCDKIVSSSLHGLITADAYQIPSLWVKFSDNVVGGDFKFLDYFKSVKRTDTKAFRINSQTTIESLLSSFESYKIDIDLDLLMDSAPFKITLPS